jgi:hypothetical protein
MADPTTEESTSLAACTTSLGKKLLALLLLVCVCVSVLVVAAEGLEEEDICYCLRRARREVNRK